MIKQANWVPVSEPKMLDRRRQDISDRRRQADGRAPLLIYAVNHILYHADQAESDGYPQDDLITNSATDRWLRIHNWLARSNSQRLVESTQVFHVIAKNNLLHLMEAQLRHIRKLAETRLSEADLQTSLSPTQKKARKSLSGNGQIGIRAFFPVLKST